MVWSLGGKARHSGLLARAGTQGTTHSLHARAHSQATRHESRASNQPPQPGSRVQRKVYPSGRRHRSPARLLCPWHAMPAAPSHLSRPQCMLPPVYAQAAQHVYAVGSNRALHEHCIHALCPFPMAPLQRQASQPAPAGLILPRGSDRQKRGGATHVAAAGLAERSWNAAIGTLRSAGAD